MTRMSDKSFLLVPNHMPIGLVSSTLAHVFSDIKMCGGRYWAFPRTFMEALHFPTLSSPAGVGASFTATNPVSLSRENHASSVKSVNSRALRVRFSVSIVPQTPCNLRRVSAIAACATLVILVPHARSVKLESSSIRMDLPRATSARWASMRTRGHEPVADATMPVLCSLVTTEACALSVSWERSWHRPIFQHAVTVHDGKDQMGRGRRSKNPRKRQSRADQEG